MKAVVIHAARDLRVEDREPETPGPGQVEVAIEAGDICGSDLHYFNHGGFGTVRIREPIIFGPRDRRHDQGDGPGRRNSPSASFLALSSPKLRPHLSFPRRGQSGTSLCSRRKRDW